jgi:hypothetical protein
MLMASFIFKASSSDGRSLEIGIPVPSASGVLDACEYLAGEKAKKEEEEKTPKLKGKKKKKKSKEKTKQTAGAIGALVASLVMSSLDE